MYVSFHKPIMQVQAFKYCPFYHEIQFISIHGILKLLNVTRQIAVAIQVKQCFFPL